MEILRNLTAEQEIVKLLTDKGCQTFNEIWKALEERHILAIISRALTELTKEGVIKYTRNMSWVLEDDDSNKFSSKEEYGSYLRNRNKSK